MTRPNLPTSGGEYVIRDGALMPADDAADEIETSPATDADPDAAAATPTDIATRRKRKE